MFWDCSIPRRSSSAFNNGCKRCRRPADEESETKKHIAIDGKTLRRSHDRKNGLGPMHIVSAWASDLGITLGQVATEEKSNEITAIPQLLELIDVEDAIVTIDAAGCQKNDCRTRSSTAKATTSWPSKAIKASSSTTCVS